MTAGRSCERCEFWLATGPASDGGTCRGGPPSVDEGQTYWPGTKHDDWCGAWRLAERLGGGADVRGRRVSNSG